MFRPGTSTWTPLLCCSRTQPNGETAIRPATSMVISVPDAMVPMTTRGPMSRDADACGAGCTLALLLLLPGCREPSEGPESSSTNSSGSSTAATLDGNTTSLLPGFDGTATSTGDTSEPECTENAECMDGELPFCGPDQQCVTCEGMSDPHGACAAVDAELPLC